MQKSEDIKKGGKGGILHKDQHKDTQEYVYAHAHTQILH